VQTSRWALDPVEDLLGHRRIDFGRMSGHEGRKRFERLLGKWGADMVDGWFFRWR
jgi:hypothetical protein